MNLAEGTHGRPDGGAVESGAGWSREPSQLQPCAAPRRSLQGGSYKYSLFLTFRSVFETAGQGVPVDQQPGRSGGASPSVVILFVVFVVLAPVTMVVVAAACLAMLPLVVILSVPLAV